MVGDLQPFSCRWYTTSTLYTDLNYKYRYCYCVKSIYPGLTLGIRHGFSVCWVLINLHKILPVIMLSRLSLSMLFICLNPGVSTFSVTYSLITSNSPQFVFSSLRLPVWICCIKWCFCPHILFVIDETHVLINPRLKSLFHNVLNVVYTYFLLYQRLHHAGQIPYASLGERFSDWQRRE